MNLTDAQVEELVQRILQDTGLARHKLGVIIDGMVSTYGIREQYLNDENNRAYDLWDFYLSGSIEALMNAGAQAFHVEALVAELYWRQQEAKANG